MSEGSQLNQTLPTLSVGNVVTIGAKLFSLKGGTYFVTSLLAHLWLYLGIGGAALGLLIVGVVAFFAGGNDPTITAIVVGLAGIMALPLIAFVWGRYLASGAFISRLVFKHLTHEKEAEETTRSQIYPRVWSYFLASVWQAIVLLFLYLGIAGLLYVLWTSLFPVVRGILDIAEQSENGSFIFISIFLLAMLLVLALFLLISYVTARLWFCDVILALEDQVGPLKSIQRSWQLTRNQGINAMAVFFVGTVVTAPPAIIASFLNYVVPVAGILLSVVVFPFWQAVKAIHYYDLRRRNEGLSFDLEALPAHPRQYLRRVALQTPESIELDFALGGIGSRALAWIIDQTLLFAGLALFWLLGSALYAYVVLPAVVDGFISVAVDDLNLWVVAISSFLTYAFSNGYYIGFETFWRGQTPGKRWAKIRVIQDNGQPVGLRESAIRSLIGPLDLYLFFLGVVLVTFGKAEKRMGDFAAGTLVIQDEKQQGVRQPTVQLEFGERSQTTAQTLIQQANLKALTADQYLTLRDFLGYRTQLEPPIRTKVTVGLANQLRQIIAPPESSAALNFLDEELLEATYLGCKETVYKQA